MSTTWWESFRPLAKRTSIRAVRAARAAYRQWRLFPAPKRGEILYRTGELLLRHKENLARQMTREMGKVLSETRGDVQEAADTAFYMAGEGRRLFGQTTPSELRDKFAMSIRMPVGVCGMITPWNFPMAIPSWKLFPALICGNTCVIKPAEDTPLSTINLVELLLEAGLPEGVVNIVTGFGPDAGAPLVSHPEVNAISFTGSSEVGRIVGQTAAGHFKPCSLEMGGKNAMIVLEDANLDLALDGAVWGAFGTTGQRCTATSRIIVQKSIAGRVYPQAGGESPGPEGGGRPRRPGGDGTADQPAAGGNLCALHRDCGKGGRPAADWRESSGCAQQGIFLCPHCVWRRGSGDAHCPGGGIWAGGQRA